jgi:hypothetical protein
MTAHLTTQPVQVATSKAGDEGCLVLADDVLVAVLVLLSDQYGPEAGRWYLETGYGPVDGLAHPTFADLDEAQEWIASRLASRL